jgi:AcrR family transcriptional regulator
VARPRTHDDRTRTALLDAAERIVATDGPHALSVRAVADEVGTSTRAVYSVFGGKSGLVAALAQRTFDVLGELLDAATPSDDPVADAVETGMRVYRPFVLEHPSLFRIAFQRVLPLELTPELSAARERTFAKLETRFERLADAGLLARRDVRAAAVEFNAMCEGLANAELRGGTLRPVEAERAWRDAFATLVRGLTR